MPSQKMLFAVILSLSSTVEGCVTCGYGRRRAGEGLADGDVQICKAAHDAAMQSISVQELYQNSGQGNADRIFDYVMEIAKHCDKEYHELKDASDPDEDDEVMISQYKQCRGYAVASALLVKQLGHQTAGTSEFLISLAGNMDDQNHSCGTIVNEVNRAVEDGHFDCLEVYEDSNGAQWAKVSDAEECQNLSALQDLDLEDAFEDLEEVLEELNAPIPGWSAASTTAVVAGSASAVGSAVTLLMGLCRSYVGQI